MSVNEQVNSVKEYAMKMESASVSWKRNFITDSLVPKKPKETPRPCKATLNLGTEETEGDTEALQGNTQP
ncbi:unnamed protein product [Camellia sinensis]